MLRKSSKLKKLQPFNLEIANTQKSMKSLKNQIVTLNSIHDIDNQNKKKQKKPNKHKIKKGENYYLAKTLVDLWLRSPKTNQVDEPQVEVSSFGVLLHDIFKP